MDMQRVFVHDLLSAVRAHITTKLRARSETANGGLPFMLAACQVAIYSIIRRCRSSRRPAKRSPEDRRPYIELIYSHIFRVPMAHWVTA